MKLADIEASFGFFDSWEDKYRFIIDLGKTLPAMADADKTDANLVRGCQSQVWLVGEFHNGALTLQIDSDAHIVRGLIAIVLAVYQNQNVEFVSSFDIEVLFEKLQLLTHLSPTRGNGLRAMIQRIRQLSAAGA